MALTLPLCVRMKRRPRVFTYLLVYGQNSYLAPTRVPPFFPSHRHLGFMGTVTLQVTPTHLAYSYVLV